MKVYENDDGSITIRFNSREYNAAWHAAYHYLKYEIKQAERRYSHIPFSDGTAFIDMRVIRSKRGSYYATTAKTPRNLGLFINPSDLQNFHCEYGGELSKLRLSEADEKEWLKACTQRVIRSY